LVREKLSSTILDALREVDSDTANHGVRVSFAALPDAALMTARHWPCWQEPAAQGRYAATLTYAVRPRSN
jgi:hypothetical protein